MAERYFGINNPNNDVFIVPQQQGGTEDDNYFGSIGDATMQHVYNLGDSGRQLWEDLHCSRGGIVSCAVENLSYNDRDEFNLRGEDLQQVLDEYVKKFGPDSPVLANLKEAIENEREARGEDESNDIMDQGTRIPYQDWERYPGLAQHVDIPSTPPKRYRYMGNVNQYFYDFFPEGHPDQKNLNLMISMVNREWEKDFDEGYADWCHTQIEIQFWHKEYARHYAHQMIDSILIDFNNIEEHVETYLKEVDRCWGIEYKNEAARKALANPMTKLFLEKERTWEQQAKEGKNVYQSVKDFGQVLHSKFYKQMNSFLWARYFKAKKTYCPRVILRNVDINSATVREIKGALNVDTAAAERIWHARPFETLHELHNKGFISGKSFSNNETMDKIINFFDNNYKKSLDIKNMRPLSKAGQMLIDFQRDGKVQLSQDEHSLIWRYYGILKQEVVRSINNGGR